MSDVFISYSRKDKDFVKTLHEALGAHNRDTWVDWSNISLTADWWQEIKTGIEAADTFIFVLSADSVTSTVCRQEIEHAVRHHKRLIPIVWRDDFENEWVHPALRKYNWLFIREVDQFNTAFQQLLQAIDTDLGHVKQHTQLLLRAIEWEHKHYSPDLLLRGRELELIIHWLTQDADKEPRSTQLQREYVNESRKAELANREAEIKRQKKVRKTITTMLAIAILSFFIAAGLGLLAVGQYQRAEAQRKEATISEIKALNTSSNALLASDQAFDALQEAMRAASRIKTASWVPEEAKTNTRLSLQQAIDTVQEQNDLDSHTNVVSRLRYSPDGKTLASASWDNTIKLWNSNGQLLKTLKGHTDFVLGISFSPDSKLLASASRDNTIKLWDLDGHELKTFIGHQAFINDVSFSPDGKTIASASFDGTIKLWDLDGHELKTFRGHTGFVESASFSPDGKTLVSASSDKTIKLWSLNGQELRTITGHSGIVIQVAFSPDGQRLASTSTDNTVKLWRVDGQELRTLKHDGLVSAVSFSPDGKWLAIAHLESKIQVYDMAGQIVATLQPKGDQLFSIDFHPNSKTLAVGTDHGTVRLWNLPPPASKTLAGHSKTVVDVDFSPDGKTIASASEDKTIRLWNRDGKTLHILQGHQKEVVAIAFNPNGQTLASGSMDGTVKLWTQDGQERASIQADPMSVFSLSFSPDGKTIASSGFDGIIKLWNLDGQLLKQFPGQNYAITTISFSPDGKTIASGGFDNLIRLWSIQGQALKTLKGHNSYIYSISFSPDGKTIASGSNDRTIKLWNLNGDELRTLRGHMSRVNSVRFNPNGNVLVSASDDKTIKLWSLDGQELKTLQGHTGGIGKALFSPDGKTIASGSGDKTIKLWDAKILDFDVLTVQGCRWLNDYLISHPEVLQDIATCKTKTNVVQAAQTFVSRGEALASHGDVKNAIAAFQMANQWNPQLGLDPQQTADQFLAQSRAQILVVEGETFAKANNIQAAIAKFQTAQQLDGNLTFNATSKAIQLATTTQMIKGIGLARQGNIKEAIAIYVDVQRLTPQAISAQAWDTLCWRGSLNGLPNDVGFACEKAVALSNRHESMLESRGVNRAMRHNLNGAIQDFEAALKQTDNEQLKARWERWLSALRANQNPITPDEVKQLLN
ncbi:MAG TPA: TIR domain-containing protein [Crinalium sp.]